MPRRKPAPPPAKEYRARTDGHPHRPWSSLNIRLADKLRFDVLHSWWSLDEGRAINQWDAFSVMMERVLLAEEVRMPPGLVERLSMSDEEIIRAFVAGRAAS